LNLKEFDWQPLLEHARAAALHAHSPYSKFRVGAAVECADGRVFVGCNVESACYGLTMCAERVALAAATAGGASRFVRLAVTCLDAEPGPAELRMPCGACRQVMSELMEPGAVVFIDGVGARTIEELLPNAFRLENPINRQ
jgi:cytidine deaminase